MNPENEIDISNTDDINTLYHVISKSGFTLCEMSDSMHELLRTGTL